MISSPYSCRAPFPGNILGISCTTIFKTALEGLFRPSKCPLKVSTNLLSFLRVLFLFVRQYEYTTQTPFFIQRMFRAFCSSPMKICFFRKEVSFSLAGLFPIVNYLVQIGFIICSNLFVLVASSR